MDGTGSIPAIPKSRNVALLLSRERMHEASLPETWRISVPWLIFRFSLIVDAIVLFLNSTVKLILFKEEQS